MELPHMRPVWSAMLKVQETLMLPILPEARLGAKLYSHLGKEESERRVTVPAEHREVWAAACSLASMEGLALRTAFVLGQRVGDVLQLVAERVRWVDDRTTSLRLLGLQFRKGKTTRGRDPFTPHLHGGLASAGTGRGAARAPAFHRRPYADDRRHASGAGQRKPIPVHPERQARGAASDGEGRGVGTVFNAPLTPFIGCPFAQVHRIRTTRSTRALRGAGRRISRATRCDQYSSTKEADPAWPIRVKHIAHLRRGSHSS
jgi:hypothetical protein